MKRFTVRQDDISKEYIIIDRLTDVKVGMFPTQKWAESIAEVMEEQHADENQSGRNGKS